MTKRIWAAFGVLALATAVAVSMANASAGILLTGTVYNASNNLPIQGVKVIVKENGDVGNGLYVYTNDAGVYQVSNLKNSWGYDLTFRKKGFVAQSFVILTGVYPEKGADGTAFLQQR